MNQPFTLAVIQSAHTDIGYTHAPEEIAALYLESYDRVLELCRATSDQPEASRFRWTCETAWQVRHYVTSRPEREQEFLSYVHSGQIELTANYLHFSDLIDADALRRSFAWVRAYCERHALPLRVALHVDINGWPWALADVLAEGGIPFFLSQTHLDTSTDPLGQRGSVHYQTLAEQGQNYQPETPFRLPQAFWWEGPSGGRVLHWLGEHYLLGNVLGISSPQHFFADKTRYFRETDRLTAADLYEIAQREIPRYVQRLRQAGYAYDAALVSTGGFNVDNAPPDIRWCEVIARWNDEHDDIQLKTVTPGMWFDRLLAQPHQDWPTRRVAWPDYWAHGLGSMTARIAQARRTQRRRADATALVTASQSAAAQQHLDMSLEQERLALEHTFAAWATTARPGAELNDFHQAAKELTFHRAALHQDIALGVALRHLTTAAPEGPRLYASLPPPATARSLHFAIGDIPLDPAHQVLVGADGQVISFQREHPNLPQFVAVVAPAAPTTLAGYGVATHEQAVLAPAGEAVTSLANSWWQIAIDPATGALTSLRDASTNTEWVGTGHPYQFGQLVHETVTHPLGRAAIGNLARDVALDVASSERRAAFAAAPVFAHTLLAATEPARVARGSVFDALTWVGQAEHVGDVRLAWRLYHALPIVELVVDWNKQWNDQPEAAYIAFGFAAPGGQLRLENSGGFFTPGMQQDGGQLPGTSSGYYTVQRAAHIATATGNGLLWLPLDAPLVMLNAINFNHWETTPYIWNGFLASMPVNHYWHTDYPTSQRGLVHLRYRFVAAGPDPDEATMQAALPSEALGWR